MEQNISRRKKEAAMIGFCAGTGFLLMLLCSRSSFLYAFNIWDDANSYFTMGKGILHGLVPYRDLFDQKGPMLYFLYALGALITERSFMGVFWLETLCAFFSLWGIYAVCRLYGREWAAGIMTPVMGALLYSARSFYWGGSAEEFMLPFLIWGLYILLRHFVKEKGKSFSWQEVLLGGILSGCVLNIKFNSLGFFFGFMWMVLYADLFSGYEENLGNRIRNFLIHCVLFLEGMLLISLPWILYFAWKRSLRDFLQVYFYLNIFVYSEKLPMAARIYRMCRIIYSQFLVNPGILLPVLLGFLFFLRRLITKKGSAGEFLTPFLTGGFLMTGIFIGGVELPYYLFPAASLAGTGAAAGTAALSYFGWEVRQKKLFAGILGGAAAFAAGICLLLSMNISFMRYSGKDLVVFRYAQIIRESGIEEPTVLNMKCLDAGLYTTAEILPTCRFFQTQTIRIEDVKKTQQKYIDEGLVDFILSRDGEPEGIEKHYKKMDETRQSLPDFDHVYYLYQKVK